MLAENTSPARDVGDKAMLIQFMLTHGTFLTTPQSKPEHPRSKLGRTDTRPSRTSPRSFRTTGLELTETPIPELRTTSAETQPPHGDTYMFRTRFVYVVFLPHTMCKYCISVVFIFCIWLVYSTCRKKNERGLHFDRACLLYTICT